MLVLHHVQGAWSALLARPAEHRLEIEQCTRLEDASLHAWVAAQDVASVRVVLPGRAVVCRTVDLGDDAAEGLLDQRLASDPAARPAVDTPIHRHASAVLPAASGVRHRTGVVLSWPESDATQLPELDITVLGVPDIAGLLQLAGAQSTAAWVDAEGGSVSIMTQGTGRLVARCVREADPAASMEGILRESAALAGNVDDALSATGTLHLNAAAAETLADLCPDAAEVDLGLYGVAIASACACSSMLAPLTVLQATAPTIERSRTQRALEAMRTPRTAGSLVAAAIALLFVGPVVVNGLRLTVLQAAHPDLGDAVAAAADVESRAQYYRVLGAEAWPMTKLLSDIGAAAPLGIVIEQIRIDHGEPVRIKGYASPREGDSAADLITIMKADLQGSGVFQDVTVEWDGKKRIGQREFTIVASVRDAKRRPRYTDENDFAAWTHQQRRHNLAKTADGGPPARPSELSSWDPNAVNDAQRDASATTTSTPVIADAGDATGETSSTSSSTSGTSSAGAGGGSATSRPGTTRPGGASRPGRGDGPTTTVDPTTIVRDGHGANGSREHIVGPGGSASHRDSGSASVGSAEFQSGDLDAGALGAMPQILTDEQLAALSEDELRAKLSEVTQARERIRDPEQSAQLRDYFKRIFDRLRELRRNGSGS